MPFISQSDFLQALGWAVISSLWQMAVLWLIYKFFVLVFKPGSALKAKAAFIVLVSGTVWFIISFILAYNSPVADTTLFTWNAKGYSLNDSISALLPYASIIYLILLAIPVTRFIINIRQVILIKTKRIKKIEVQWRLFVKKMAAYLEIKKPVQVWISENISSPVTIGFLKPIILVPLAAVNSLNTQQMEAVLLHELAHIKRYDYLLNIITVIIRTLFYFNPFARNLTSIIEDEREKSCDEWVLQYQYDAYSYSAALLALEQMKISTVQLALAASGKKELLLNRIKKIMGIPSGTVFSVKNSFGWISGIACSMVLFFMLFANAVKTEPSPVAFTASPLSYLQNINPDINLNEFRAKINPAVSVVAGKKKTNPENNFIEVTGYFSRPEINSNIIPASFTEPVTSELDEEKELQVKETMEASKKILQNLRWKEINASVADALTELEKQDLQKLYKEKLATEVNWKELENKLRLSYNQLNWDNINARTINALTEIKIDSLKYVYTIALNHVLKAKEQLTAEGLKGIPDSEITIAELDASKKNLNNSLNKLKAVKEKKIIRL